MCAPREPLSGPRKRSLAESALPRAVLDTNVLVSALLQPLGAPAGLVRAWAEGRLSLVVCPELMQELSDVLARPRIARRISREEADAFVKLIWSNAELRDDPVPEPGLTRDPDDDYLLAHARRVGADFLVSGDRHLLDLDRPPVLILTPSDLTARLRLREPGREPGR